MNLVELIRIAVPGIILGLLLAKLLSKKPHYLKLLKPKPWIKSAKKASKRRWAMVILLSLLFGFLSLLVMPLSIEAISEIWGPAISEENIFTEISAFSLPILIFFITVMPIFEEWLFRGVILEEISRISESKWAGLIFSSLLFALFHLSNPGTYLAAVIPYFVGGIIIGGSYLAGGLAVAILGHITYNLLPYILWLLLP